MALEVQNAVVELVAAILGADSCGTAATPTWLRRPGKKECGHSWNLAQEIYADLTSGAKLPETMPLRETRRVDCVLTLHGEHRILEVDEKQHFNHFRAQTLAHYTGPHHATPIAFPAAAWIAKGTAKGKLEGGGFARPCPPLFPEPNGRHQQRAFRDALADLLPIEHGWLPTPRIADFEVKDWLRGPLAHARMEALLGERL